MRKIDEQYIKNPSYGARRMAEHLCRNNYRVNRKRVSRLYQKMGIEARYPKPSLSKTSREHLKFPYLLRNLKIDETNQVWGADITYIPTMDGYLYLVAILDLFSRYVVSWRLSNNMESEFCLEALDEAFNVGSPRIFNTDQGVQFTCKKFIQKLQAKDIKISMNGKGKCWDNIFVERLWRTVKQEDVYIRGYENGKEALECLDSYMTYYNTERLHQSLSYRTPAEVFQSK